MVSNVALSFLGLCLCGGVTSVSSNPPSTSPDDVILPSCPPGTRLVPAKGNRTEHCMDCPSGQFTRNWSRGTSCLHHSKCKNSEWKISNGTTSDTVCTCKDGARTYIIIDERVRRPDYVCRPCEDKVATQVVNGTDEGDRVCCPPGMDAYRAPSGKVECQNRTDLTVTWPPSWHPDNGTNTATCPNNWSAGFAVLYLLLGVVISLAGMFLYSKRGNITAFFKEKCVGGTSNESNDGADERLPTNTS